MYCLQLIPECMVDCIQLCFMPLGFLTDHCPCICIDVLYCNVDIRNSRIIGKYIIYKNCYKYREIFPELGSICDEYIVFNMCTMCTRTMNGEEIYIMLKKSGIFHEQFNHYGEIIRKRDNPTPEELAEKQEIIRKQQEKEEIERLDLEECQRIIDKYKASSRLDKLKRSIA